MIAIHQFVAGFSNGDAISNEALLMRRIFRGWGFDSEIYSETRRILPELRSTCRDAETGSGDCRPGDVALLHLSVGSVVNDVFAALPCRKALLYHNVTPPRYFATVNVQTAASLERGIAQTRALAGAAAVNLADSSFNAAELERLGYRGVRVLPLMFDVDGSRRRWDRGIVRRLRDGRVNVLFVGRGAPNKRLDDLLRLFHYFQKFVQPDSRLVHVGSFAGTERYHALLLTLARELRLRDVRFAGSVPENQLRAYYRAADLFVSMSEHEGFCAPVLESMTHDVPVAAYAAAAVPETMDGAGVLIERRDFAAVAELMGRLVSDRRLRDAVLRAQRARIERYRQRDPAAELRRLLAPLLEEPS